MKLPSINKEHRGDVQALRAVAVILVILYHLKIIKGGFLGVDIFFVISGYVITLNLSKSQGSLKEKLTKFYLRRAKRILPSSLVVVILTALLTKIFLAPIYQGRFRIDALWSSLMGANIGFGLHGLDYLQATTAPSPFLHYWSLGVEEQFYIIWPLIFFLFISKRSPKIFAVILPASIAIALITTAIYPVFSFYLPTSRAFQFLFGAGLAIGPTFKGNKNLLAAFGWAGIIGSALLIPDNLANPNRFSMIPTVSTMLVIYAESKLFTFKSLQYIGEISFTLYLVHWPVILLLGNGSQNIHGAKIFIALLAMAIATLLLSTFIELPFRYESFGHISPRNWVIILALGTVIAQAAYLLPGKSGSDKFQLDLSKPIIYTNGCHLDQRHSALNKNCTFGNTGPKVLLVGDSHAAQWFPAFEKLANENKLTFTSQTKSSCPITTDSVYANGQIDKSCDKWHVNIVNLIRNNKFDYLIFSNFDHNNYKYSGNNGINNFISSIGTTKVIQLMDTPKPPNDSVACLSANPSNPSTCSFPVQSIIKFRTSAIDPTLWLCTDICPAVLNGFNTYRDGSHISVITAKNLSEKLYLELLKYNR